ncbi:MAG: (2Fe-2S) ferredoxin domain-containing protein [Candidatus Cloacimonadales bacterium]
MKKIDLSICLGSSCYPRGNKANLQKIKQFIEDNHLQERVNLKGSLCLKKCKEGPVLVIDGEIFTKINEMSVIDLLQEKLRSLQ